MVHIAVDNTPPTILFLAANPVQNQLLDLGEECRAIEDRIRSAKFGDQLRFRSRWAVRPDDLLQALHEDDPAVLHFSGHGTGAQGLCFLDTDGGVFCVNSEGLKQIVQAAGDRTKLIVLNACYTSVQAEALVTHVPCVVGMPEAIGDKAAIIYSSELYRAIAFGRSIATSHQCGLAALAIFSANGRTRDIELAETALHTPTPVLLTRTDVNAKYVHIVDNDKHAISSRQEGVRVHVEIDIDTTFETLDASLLAKIVHEIQRLSGGRAVKIVCVTKGSVRLTISLLPNAARLIMKLRMNGDLSKICTFGIKNIIEHGEIHTSDQFPTTADIIPHNISPATFLGVMRNMVIQHYPSCIDIYDIEINRFAEQLAMNRSLRKLYGKTVAGEFGADLAEAVSFIDVIAIVSAGWSIVSWIHEHGKQEQKSNIETKFSRALINEGMTTLRAQDIARRLSQEIVQFIVNSSPSIT